MSKAFTKESDNDEDDDLEQESPAPQGKNYMTPAGVAALQKELQHLLRTERPKIVETVAWAAGNGDRSENGDYIYGKKRLREIDRRARYITKQLRDAVVVDPVQQQQLTQVFFGATVTYIPSDGKEHVITLVGIDEADINAHKISWISPLAKALMKAHVGDSVEFQSPAGAEEVKITAIRYIV